MDFSLFTALLNPFHSFLQSYPNLSTLLAIIGFLRAINKPLFAAARLYVQNTATLKDDQELDKIEKSPQYKTLLFILDWFASVKPLSDSTSTSKEEKKE
jgi:hypothetical protein